MAITLLIASASAPAQTAAEANAARLESLRAVFPQLASRLSTLTPDGPEAYLELGEELLAEARTDAEFGFVAELFAHAYSHARENDPALANSACLALTEVTSSPRDVVWLRLIAGIVDPSRRGWGRPQGVELDPALALDAAGVISALRAADGVTAKRLLGRRAIRSVIQSNAGLMTSAGRTEVLSELDSQAELWPCPTCQNERIVNRRVGDRIVAELCPTCNGAPGWKPGAGTLTGQLRFEAVMLGEYDRSWAAQFAVDLGAPLRDPDPDELPAVFGVDPAMPFWRGGRWSSTP
ncbi:MAG: hypothetical protein CMJ31_14110 [Phycisphaerae bacterium]|nr:hypothetical protein [Phycisphaerae bacterium]